MIGVFKVLDESFRVIDFLLDKRELTKPGDLSTMVATSFFLFIGEVNKGLLREFQ